MILLPKLWAKTLPFSNGSALRTRKGVTTLIVSALPLLTRGTMLMPIFQWCLVTTCLRCRVVCGFLFAAVTRRCLGPLWLLRSPILIYTKVLHSLCPFFLSTSLGWKEWVDEELVDMGFMAVKDIFLCNWHILWKNSLYLYLGKSKKVQDNHYKWLNWRHEDCSRIAQEKWNLQVLIPYRQKLDMSRFIKARHMFRSIELMGDSSKPPRSIPMTLLEKEDLAWEKF